MSTSQEPITTQNETTSKSRSDDAKTLKQDAGPHLQGKTTSDNETTSKTKHGLVTDAEASVEEITPVENETASKDSPSKITAAHEKIRDDDKSLKEDAPKVPKEIPMWRKCKNLIIKRGIKSAQPKPSVRSEDPEVPANLRAENLENYSDELNSVPRWKVLANLIEADVDYITERADNLKNYSDRLNSVRQQVCNAFDHLKESEDENGLTEMSKVMMKLKLQISTKLHPAKDHQKELEKILQLGSKVKQTIADRALGMMPQLYNNSVFESSIEFKDFEVRYNILSLKLKLCLLCFSIFPEKAIIKKRLMLQWWVAEGFVPEDNANKCFMKLITKGFIEPVNNNKSLDVGLCQMHPFYRSALITLAARAKFFNFDKKGMPTQNFIKSFQACLVGKGLISYEDLMGKKGSTDDLENVLEKIHPLVDVNEHTLGKKVSVDELEKIHLLMNVSEHTLDFKLGWFSRMKNVNLLYLGKWSASSEDHIEVEDTAFLEGLKNMQYLKFLSLQRVWNIISLPESILQLKNLKILDLRGCREIEILPEGIGLLKSLTHLDMSECPLLSHMPGSLSSLLRLKVLKGFVVGTKIWKSSCELRDLRKLKNLIKLCIYTGLETFPEVDHVRALEDVEELKKLKITWRGLRAENGDVKHEKKEKEGSSDSTSKGSKSLTRLPLKLENLNGLKPTAKLPSKLEKLDLEHFPMSKTPSWLEIENLTHLNLKKLYIRGGNFCDLGQCQDWNVKEKYTWKVETLRLKYLSEIELEWRQLQELFPDLVFLEQVSCPKLTFVPCDANGLWINETKL